MVGRRSTFERLKGAKGNELDNSAFPIWCRIFLK
jgi:hypothetical protein